VGTPPLQRPRLQDRCPSRFRFSRLREGQSCILACFQQRFHRIQAKTGAHIDLRVKAILLDLDGTIGNTLPLCITAFRESIEPLVGRALTDEEIVATFGPSEEGTIAVLLPEQRAEGLDRYLRRYEELHCRWPSPFEGISEILSYLKAKRIFVGLITGKGRRSTELTLKSYGLEDYFDVIKTGASSGPVKDRRIEEVIEELSLAREEILYVGDAPSDVKACRDCNIKIAAAAWAPTANAAELEQMRPDFLFSSVSAFSDFLRKSLE
jgi:phosphoglycolate phosphatase-like HAD superfamily hydrolase